MRVTFQFSCRTEHINHSFLHCVSGESGIDMFIIETGLVEVVSADGTVLLAKLRAGDYLGESCLLGTTTTTRTASAYSCGYTHTYVLKGQDFRNVSTY